MDTAHGFEELGPGTQQQVEGIGEQHLRAGFENVLAALPAHRSVRTHGHERRGQNFVVRGAESRRAGT
jgi:hypothetical protein